MSEPKKPSTPVPLPEAEDLERLDELELSEMVSMARESRAAGDTVSHEDVKKRLGLDEQEPEKRRRGDGGD
jgi:hypothetical protein